MESTNQHDAIPFLPKRLRTSLLQAGLREFSAHFLFDRLGLGTLESVEWQIEPADDEGSVTYSRERISEAELQQGAILINATLPPAWDHGSLKVSIKTATDQAVFHGSIDIFNQMAEFVLPLPGQALTVAGHRIGEAHRSALQIPSQQFGWDFIGLGGDRLAILRAKPATKLAAADFSGFGMDILTPGPGKVIKAIDGFDDLLEAGQQPQDLSPYQEDLYLALGNFLVIDHGRGIFSLLAHLQKGSLIVVDGQQLAARQRVAALGNSGFSSGPHLHCHFMDGPDILTASPLPVALTLEDGVYAPESGNIVSNA